MNDAPAYGLWSLVIVNSLVFAIFAFSFAKPAEPRRVAFWVSPAREAGMPTKYVESRIRESQLIVSRSEQVFDELRKYGADLRKYIGASQDESLEKRMR